MPDAHSSTSQGGSTVWAQVISQAPTCRNGFDQISATHQGLCWPSLRSPWDARRPLLGEFPSLPCNKCQGASDTETFSKAQ